MSDVYDQRGRLVEWEPDDVPGPTVEQLNAVIDSLNALVTRLQRECAAHEQALTMVEEENEKLRTLLLQLKTGGSEGCWCAFAIGHPQYSDHTPTCKDIQALLGADA